jgi:hypothetical protein
MKNIKYLLFSISILTSCSRVSIPSNYKDSIKICYTGENIGASSSINIHGYYEMDLLEKNSNKISNQVYNLYYDLLILPVLRFLNFVLTNAPPLPGLTC